jgi:hypothetical protein
VPDLSHAYASGIGVWDKVTINYGYRQFSEGSNERFELDAILNGASKSGLIYISDEDARPAGGAHPYAHLWDNGQDAAEELIRIMRIRAAALTRFGENAIPMGAPMAQLQDTLAPLYLMHRYQTEAAIKEIGGLDYRYQLRGDGQQNAAIVSSSEQRKALRAVMMTLSPEALTLPESLLQLLPPRPPGFPRTAESLPANTGLTFDPIAAAESAADLTLSTLFNAQRAARIVEYNARVAGLLRLDEVLEAALAASRPPRIRPEAAAGGLIGQVQSAIYARTVEAVLRLAADPKTSVAVRAISDAKLDDIKRHAELNSPVEVYLNHRIQEFQSDPKKFVVAKPVEAPPGMPIGDEP